MVPAYAERLGHGLRAILNVIYFVLKNLALFKNNADKLNQNKAHGFGICCLFSVAVRPHVLAMFLYVVCVVKR